MIVFAIPIFLWGLLAAVLPWFLRRRLPREIPRTPFAFISFLRELDAQEFLSPRVQEWLLLLLRVLIIVGLVLATADPVWVSGEWGRTRDQARAALKTRSSGETVLLLDRSASMRQTTGGISIWRLTVDQTKPLLGSASDRDWALGFWTDGRGMAAPLTDQLNRGSAADLVSVLDETEPLDRSSDFSLLVDEMGREAIAGPVVLLTDHQASGWRRLLSGPLPDRPLAVPLWVVPLGEPPRSGVWIDIAALSSFPWAVGFDEEIQVTVRQWERPSLMPHVSSLKSDTDLFLQLRLEKPSLKPHVSSLMPHVSSLMPESVVLAEALCELDPSPPFDVVVDHPVRLSVRLGSAAGEQGVLSVALVLTPKRADSSPLARVAGDIPVLAGEPLSLLGGGPFMEAVTDCFQTQGTAHPFSATSMDRFEEVPLDHLAVTTLSSLLASSGGVGEAASWVRRGGRCLLFIDSVLGAGANPRMIDLLFRWEAGKGGARPDGAYVEDEHVIGTAFADFPEEAWREWRSFVPGYCPAARRIVYFQGAGEDHTDIIGELAVGLGRIVFINVGSVPRTGPLRSPLFPVAVIESLKSLASEGSSDSLLRVGSRPEDDIRPLSDDDREALEQTGLVRFVKIDEITRQGALLASPVRLRSALLALVILLGLVELWLANRGFSA